MSQSPAASASTGTSDAYSAWKGRSYLAFGSFTKGEARAFAWQLRRLGYDRKVVRILEIGFGNGNFLGWAHSRGHEVHGIETNSSLVLKAQGQGFPAFISLDEIPTGMAYDLIVALDVLEHIPLDQLPGLFSELKTRLLPGGCMIFRFPNGDSPFGRAIQYGDLTHVTVLGSDRVVQLCSMTGLRISHRGEAPWYVIHPERPIKGLLYAGLRWGLERFLHKVYFKRRIALSPNLLVIVERDAGSVL